jgi:hypothetical protein
MFEAIKSVGSPFSKALSYLCVRLSRSILGDAWLTVRLASTPCYSFFKNQAKTMNIKVHFIRGY